MKCLTCAGLGKQQKQAKPMTEEEDEILWSKSLLRGNEPKIVVNILVYLFGKFFAHFSGKELMIRSLTFTQLEVNRDNFHILLSLCSLELLP